MTYLWHFWNVHYGQGGKDDVSFNFMVMPNGWFEAYLAGKEYVWTWL